MPDQQHTDSEANMPIDADVDLHQTKSNRHRADTITMLVTISIGGAIGAGARYIIGITWPTSAGAFPISTLTINILGCALIGILMVLITEGWNAHRLLRPFLGTGILGGFTTFSTYTVDVQQLVIGAHANTALLYLALTPIGALIAVWVSATTTRRLINWRIQ